MKPFFARVLHSMMLRLGLVIGAMGCMICAVVVVSWMVFNSIESKMANLSEERLPVLRGSAEVIAVTDETRALLSSVLLADSYAALSGLATRKEQVISDFATALDQLPAEERASATAILTEVDTALTTLLSAREAEMRADESTFEAVESAFGYATYVSGRLEEASDTAVFNMTLQGEETMGTIDETMTRLVDVDFSQFQTVLSMRSEVNLLSGLALAVRQDRGGELTSIATDLGLSAISHLKTLIDTAGGQPTLSDVNVAVTDAVSVFESVFDGTPRATSVATILEARLAVDTVLSPAIDDIYFNLIIGSDEAREQNNVTLTNLLDVEVASMRRMAALDSATKLYFAILLQIALAQDSADLTLSQGALVSQTEIIQAMTEDMDGIDIAIFDQLFALSSPDTGMADKRSAALQAENAAMRASKQAAEAVGKIALETAAFSATALDQIAQTATDLSAGVQNAGVQIAQIALAALCLLLVTPVLLWFYVSRPLNRVTAVTERLAAGDLSEIDNLAVNQGELGRLSGALHIFRSRALETIKLQEEDKQREREALKAEHKAERVRQEEEEKRKAELREREEAERLKEAEDAAKERQQAQKVEAERTERIKEQELIVSTLAEGLERLSAGDLTFSIKDKFPDAYEELRQNFNAAMTTLSDIVSRLNSSATNIADSSAEISGSSQDLAGRTEANGTTLAKTAETIGQLTSTVASTASGAGSATDTVLSLTKESENNKKVMAQANQAMKNVQESSSKISSIVSVIDSIAFQTNLLALNAGVEAARAGEAGQGFSVVASEVRILAKRCSDSASEISSVIEESVKIAREGAVLTEQANDAMSVIDVGVSGISEIMQDIAGAAQQQSQKLNDVNAAVQELDKSTQQNAAMFEETTAANTALTDEAQALSQIVAGFRFHNQMGNTAQTAQYNLRDAS